VVLKWSLQRGVAVVTGTDNPAHMASDLDLWGFTLTDQEMTELNTLKP
jgi:2,5-diketo-D-gluconate reductase A